MDEDLNKSIIAKNTLLLYFRLLFTVVVGLYTSRVILDKLGVDDYGIYNVVGGIVAMMSFLNSAMVAASQRFLSYELGKGDADRLKNVFNTSVHIHLLIAGIIFVAAETLGLWVVNNYLNIASDRMFAANFVYQTSIFTFLITVISVPFNSCVISHERMNMFAYTSIIEALLKLLICYLLGVAMFDRLVFYGFLIFCISLIVSLSYIIYCRRNFSESKITRKVDKKLFNEMMSFAGWNLFGNIGSSFKDQIINVILNVFCGTRVNAARGIALQVNSIVNTLASNVAMAINPQITKQFAAGNIQQSQILVFACARYSFYLLTLIAIPFFLNIDVILGFWLKEVPEYASEFLIIAIIVSLVYTLTGPISTAIQATGRVKSFQIGVCVIMLLEVPFTYLLLYLKYSPIIAVIPTILTNTIALFYRYCLIHCYISGYLWHTYLRDVILKSWLIFIVAFLVCKGIDIHLSDSVIGSLISIIISCFIVLTLVYTFGTSKTEKETIIQIIKKKLLKI